MTFADCSGLVGSIVVAYWSVAPVPLERPVPLVHSSNGVLIYERSPYWGPELKRQFSEDSVYVHECRTVQDLLPAASTYGHALVLLVLDDDPGDCLAWIMGRFQSASHLPVVVIASQATADVEWILREAGVAGFIHDEISGDRLRRLCCRLLRIEMSDV